MNNLVYRWISPRLSESGFRLLKSTIESDQWSYGPIARLVEREIAIRLGINNVLLTNSGTSALWILLSLARQQGKEQAVIVPAFGYSAAANVAATLGYELYIADSSADTPVVDPKSVKRLIDDKVTFIIGINYFGYSVDWDSMPATEHVTSIEDAAGSFGARYKGQACGSSADLSIVSFHTSKAAAAGGEGGCVVTRREDVIQRARAAGRNGHIKGFYFSEMAGMNMLMPDISACFLRDSLEHLSETISMRQKVVETIDELVKAHGLETPRFNFSNNDRTQNFQAYATLIDNRDFAVDLLRLNGIEARPCWPFLVTEQPATRGSVKRVDGELANAKRFASRILNIPVNPMAPASSWTTKLDSILAHLSLSRTIKSSQQRSKS